MYKEDNMSKESIRKEFVDLNVFGNTIPVEKALTLDETIEVNGERKYAGLKIAPKVVISPMSKSEMVSMFKDRGVPVKYYNHIKRLSEYRNSQIRGHKDHKFVSVNLYDEHMERDNDKTNRMRHKMDEEGISMLDMGNF